ncbi:MAG: amidohydrolase family protein [Candidatus Omnitrophica bacterium]|nr:amidohydrolase family protein [Candidatus Omnitrophota bacterium]
MRGENISYCDHTGLWKNELLGWVPEYIFDAHVHLGPPGIMKPISPERAKEPLATFTDFTWEDSLRIYKQLFSSKKIAGVCAFGFPLREVDIEAANSYIADLMADSPHLYGFIISDPFDTGRTIALFNSAMDKGIRFRGVKPYFDFLGKPNLLTRMYEFVPSDLLEFMNSEKLILMLHTAGMGMCDRENQDFVRAIAEKFPGIKIILAHMGRYVYPEQFFTFLASGVADIPSVFLDVSSATVTEVYEKTLSNERLREKLLFATDMPYGLITGTERFSEEKGFSFITRDDYPWSDPALQKQFSAERERLTYNTYHVIKALKDAMERLGISGQAEVQLKEDVFFRNAARIFNAVD